MATYILVSASNSSRQLFLELQECHIRYVRESLLSNLMYRSYKYEYVWKALVPKKIWDKLPNFSNLIKFQLNIKRSKTKPLGTFLWGQQVDGPPDG